VEVPVCDIADMDSSTEVVFRLRKAISWPTSCILQSYSRRLRCMIDHLQLTEYLLMRASRTYSGLLSCRRSHSSQEGFVSDSCMMMLTCRESVIFGSLPCSRACISSGEGLSGDGCCKPDSKS
jgi:hypothetical protein